jgi:two-component system, sensor histidine kinase
VIEASGQRDGSAPGLDRFSLSLLAIQAVTLALYSLIVGFGAFLDLPDNLSTTLNIVSDACAALACLHAARCPGGERYAKAWRRFAAAYAVYVVGSLGWFVPEFAEQADRGLSVLDGPYFMFYPLVFLAVWAWPRQEALAARRVSDWVDALVVPIGAGMAVWFGLAEATLQSLGTNPGGAGGVLLYPFADLFLLLAVVFLTRDPADDFARLAGRFVALSLFVSTIADVGLALALIREARADVAWPDAVYVASALIMTASASVFRLETLNASPLARRFRSGLERLPRLRFLLPAVGAGVGFLFLVYDALSERDIRGVGVAVGASLLVVLGLIRVVLSDTEASRDAARLSATLDQLRETQKTAEAARESAESALRAKGEFFAVMGHEIRTPLNAVIGMTQILLNTPLSSTPRESAEVIRQGGDALLAVVNDLLDFSKMEAGRLEIESLPLNPTRTIERLVMLMQATAKARGLTIEVHQGNLPRLAVGDEARLGQILLNLLSNAIKFSQAGVIRVKADAVATDVGFELTVSVSDPGVGIPKDKLPMLFQPFAQLSPGRARAYGGTGLGLVICKRLTEMMGGWIRVESEPGKGSTFSFRVRLGFANQLNTVPLPAVVPGLPRRREPSAPLSVLVIEDNPVNQLVARSMVELLGHKVDVADSGAAAVEDVRTRAYDVILTDLMMPEMDGVETTHRLRELENGRKALIVALTAAATVEDRERCLAAGMDGFLAKPFTLEALRSLFTRFD